MSRIPKPWAIPVNTPLVLEYDPILCVLLQSIYEELNVYSTYCAHRLKIALVRDAVV